LVLLEEKMNKQKTASIIKGLRRALKKKCPSKTTEKEKEYWRGYCDCIEIIMRDL